MKNKLLILFAFLAIGIMSCDLGDDPDPGGTATQAVAGEWYTTFTVNGEDVYGIGYALITTSNTAANVANEFLVTDNGNQWDYKVKSPLNLDAKTFGGTDLQNIAYDIKVNITDERFFQVQPQLPVAMLLTVFTSKSNSLMIPVLFMKLPDIVAQDFLKMSIDLKFI